MKVFKTGAEIIEAIINCKDPKETKEAISTVVKFALHDKSLTNDNSLSPGLANKVMLSMLLMAVQELGEPKGGE